MTVRAYHSLPGAGLSWPADFVEMSPAGGLTIPSIGANNTQEVTVGPFEWTPNVNAYGHDCVLMIASTAGDPSNIDNFTGAETIAEWRLVPNDNNVGQRNVNVVPGGGGPEAFMKALDGAIFFAGNPFNRRAQMKVRLEMPRFLAQRGWGLRFPGVEAKFELKPNEKRKVTLHLTRGSAFTADDARNATDRDINVYLYGNGILIGGMTYRLDPELKEPSGGVSLQPGRDCKDAAQRLLDCLNVPGDQRVKKVCVKKVSLDIQLDNDCDCN